MLATILIKKLYFKFEGITMEGSLEEISEGVFTAKCKYIHEDKSILQVRNVEVHTKAGDHIGDITQLVNLEQGDTLDIEYNIHVEEV